MWIFYRKGIDILKFYNHLSKLAWTETNIYEVLNTSNIPNSSHI